MNTDATQMNADTTGSLFQRLLKSLHVMSYLCASAFNLRLSAFVVALFLMASTIHGQERGAVRLNELVSGLTVTPRVLLIGARPTDADEDLIAWLARGHHVQTGFLSLTRGESAPNYTGLEGGATLGAVHVQEMIAARRIEGGEQFFTRAFDFGMARSAADVFEQWDRATLLGDAVQVVRAFRPQVIVALSRPDTVDRDGQHQAAALIARDVFDAALDTVNFPVKKFGIPWTPTSLYEPGSGTAIDSRNYDAVRGRMYAALAAESRAQLRSFGFATPPWREPRNTEWRRIATRVDESASAGGDASLFAGIDTSFMRLQKDVPIETVRRSVDGQVIQRPLLSQLPGIVANADSARALLDLRNPGSIVPYLKNVVELSTGARNMLRGCRHPARNAAMSISYQPCRPEWLDLDASLDLVQRRSNEALLEAAGVTVEITADREFLASYDTALVTITVYNHSDAPVSVNDVAVTGAVPVRMTETVRVPAHGKASVYRQVVTIAYAHPYWIYKRDKNFYPSAITSLDGVARPALFNERFGINASTIPADVHRLSDVTATITVGRTTVTSSVGELQFRTAEPMFGVRDRALSGVPPVTITFERALEWAQAGKPIKKQVRLIVRSYADQPVTLALKAPAVTGQVPGRTPPGSVKYDSLPPAMTLAPHEAREVTVQVRGRAEEQRYDLSLIGVAGKDTFNVGFRSAQYSYLPPLHLFRESKLSVMAVTIKIPERLNIVYVRGAGDDADVGLKQLGIPVYPVNNEGLTRIDLDGVSTVMIGPDAFRVDRDLVTQMPRLTEFARKGGTVVILDNSATMGQQALLPYPVSFARPFAESVTREDAEVVVTDAKSRVMTWPNEIHANDFGEWVGSRAVSVPTTVDSRWSMPIETHDPRQPANRNALLVATVGKGRIIYSSLTLTQQITNAVPGAMRVLVNLASAGLSAEPK
jgi:LmbE family N-acetylglucosaminyl deacetylase